MQKLILDKSKWICGRPMANEISENYTGSGYTQLLNIEGYSCCLGQFIPQINKDIDNLSLLGTTNPSDINKPVDGLNYCTNGGNWRDTNLSSCAVDINDNSETTVEHKIELLKEIFLKHGFEIEVIN